MTALNLSRSRLGDRAKKVEWIEADITQVTLPDRHYDLWHDRALFHFLREAKDRETYTKAMQSTLKPDGHVIIATFSPQAPPRCSGLDVIRYDPQLLQAELGTGFRLGWCKRELHYTPSGIEQEYLYCHFQRAR